jgi:hypothetical protein
MLALAGCGERAAALGVYEEIRRRLAQELGVDPGAELRSAHLTVLDSGERSGPPTAEPAPASPVRAAEPAPASAAPAPVAPVSAAPASASTAGTVDVLESPTPLRWLGGFVQRPVPVVVGVVFLVAALVAGVYGIVAAVRGPAGDAAGGPGRRPTVAAGTGASAGSRTYTPTAKWSWVDDASLGQTGSGEQWASAHVFGLIDSDHVAGFRLRNDGGDGVLVAVSGTEWKIEAERASSGSGNFTPTSDGVLRVAISETNVVTVTYSGELVTSRPLRGQYPGRGVSASVWQSTIGVRMTDIQSNAVAGR